MERVDDDTSKRLWRTQEKRDEVQKLKKDNGGYKDTFQMQKHQKSKGNPAIASYVTHLKKLTDSAELPMQIDTAAIAVYEREKKDNRKLSER